MLLDPADAVLVYFFGFLWQHGVLQVRSVETHGKPRNTLDRKYVVTVDWKRNAFKNVIGHIHLWPSHVQLVEDIFLDTRSGGGCQSHHWHTGELLAQFM